MIDTKRLSLGLLITAVVLVIVALATPRWGCGNLFTDCPGSYYRDIQPGVIAVIVIITLGLVFLCIVLLFELIACCNPTFYANVATSQARLVLLLLGVVCLMVALLVFTGVVAHNWSFVAAIIGAVLALQVAILALMTSTCVTYTTRTERVIVTTR